MHVNYKNIFTYDLLFDMYVNQRLTSRQIAKMYNTTKSKVLQDLKRFNISQEDQINSYKINEIQHDLIIGSILGDGTFCTDGNDYRMSFRQAENQKDYLLFKFEIMKEFCKKKTVGISDGNYKSFNNAQLIYYFHTRTLSIFNTYKEMSISDCLRELNANSFAVWLMDDGTLRDYTNKKYTPYYSLSAKRFSVEEAQLTQEILKAKLGINTTINIAKNDYYKNGRKYELNGFYFPTSETYKVLEVIKSSDFGEDIIRTMNYKIPA